MWGDNGNKWSDIQYKGILDTLTTNGITSERLLADVAFGDLRIAEGTTAVSKGVLRRLLQRMAMAPAPASAAPAQAGPCGLTAHWTPSLRAGIEWRLNAH